MKFKIFCQAVFPTNIRYNPIASHDYNKRPIQ